jgi:hypothetical protein
MSTHESKRARMTLLSVVALCAVAALLWVGGELHRSNCLREGRSGCSVLAWKSGKPKPKPKPCGQEYTDESGWAPGCLGGNKYGGF